MHDTEHELFGREVILGPNAADPMRQVVVAGAIFRVEDWWDRVAGKSWTASDGNPAAMMYGLRAGMRGNALPYDDEVLYGKIGAFGHLVHVSELGEVAI